MSTNTNWAIDPAHSEIGFKVKHMMFTNVSGKFNNFSAEITTNDDDFSTANINFEAAVDSISTGNTDRDNHLLSPDFFDAAQFPKLQFKGTSFTKVDEGDYKLNGDLTMHGVTKPVTLDVEYGGLMKDPWGNIKAGFSITGKITRKEWGLAYNAVLDNGGILLSEDVKLNFEVQLVKQS
jgi:polyisoprenoid-binding protein YceI